MKQAIVEIMIHLYRQPKQQSVVHFWLGCILYELIVQTSLYMSYVNGTWYIVEVWNSNDMKNLYR